MPISKFLESHSQLNTTDLLHQPVKVTESEEFSLLLGLLEVLADGWLVCNGQTGGCCCLERLLLDCQCLDCVQDLGLVQRLGVDEGKVRGWSWRGHHCVEHL